ncbi:dipeptide ABC transporter ATP-binding protein [Kribbella sp. NPDC050820]|uniref:ABC transporter ATP-binding protein n=1 Tax=Kribbella sp. NPDC050820 TaxID=3155408 RepID=UPI0033F7B6DB
MPAHRDQQEPILEIDRLVKHYPVRRGLLRRQVGAVQSVDGVSLRLFPGETLGLVGESGCGKSTLTRVVLALEKPSSGEVRYRGSDVFKMTRPERRQFRREVQVVFQDPYASLDPRMTVDDIVSEGLRAHPEIAGKSGHRERVKELLERVGLNADHSGRYPHEFSGGQRQRIGIARALAVEPRVLLCDEPVSALDVSVQAQVINLLEDLQNDLGLSYLFIAHDLSVVRHISDRVAVMYLGRIIETGTDQDIYAAATHPYTQALLSSSLDVDRASSQNFTPILLGGELPSAADPPTGCRFRTRCWKARDVCAAEDPPLVDRHGHPSACHFAAELHNESEPRDSTRALENS